MIINFDDDDDSDGTLAMTTMDIFMNRFIKVYDNMLLFQIEIFNSTSV